MAKVKVCVNKDDEIVKTTDGAILVLTEDGDYSEMNCNEEVIADLISKGIFDVVAVPEDLEFVVNEERDECLYTENGVTSPKSKESPPRRRTDGNSGWTVTNTKMLISAVNDLAPKIGHTLALKTQRKMWIQISKMFQEQLYTFSPIQCQNRWKTLKRGFKKKLKNNYKTGRAKRPCYYARDLNNVLTKRPALYSGFMLSSFGEGSSKSDGVDENSTDVCSESASSPNGCDSTTPKKKRRKTITEELRYFTELKMKHHKERLEAFRERTAAIEKKNALLEELVTVLKTK